MNREIMNGLNKRSMKFDGLNLNFKSRRENSPNFRANPNFGRHFKQISNLEFRFKKINNIYFDYIYNCFKANVSA